MEQIKQRRSQAANAHLVEPQPELDVLRRQVEERAELLLDARERVGELHVKEDRLALPLHADVRDHRCLLVLRRLLCFSFVFVLSSSSSNPFLYS